MVDTLAQKSERSKKQDGIAKSMRRPVRIYDFKKDAGSSEWVIERSI